VGGEGRSLENPSPSLVEALTGGRTSSSKAVSIDGSMKLVPIYSGVSLLAGSIGSLPLMVYRRVEGGREKATSHRTWRLIHDQPNPEMAADELWEMIAAHLLLWGNGFLAKVRNNLGVVSELWPLRPNRVQVGKDPAGNRFFILDGNLDKRYTEEDILHIRGLGTDGLVGLSPIQQAREMLGASMALEEFTGRFWANSANPGGTLEHPQKLSEDAQARLRKQWKQIYGGPKNAGEVMVLEEGMSWSAVGMPLKDAQFIETAQWGNLQVALLLRLPPGMLGAKTGDSMTYSNTESEGIDFVRWSLRRWLVRIENAVLRDPSIFVQGDRFYPEFLLEGLLRADTKTRFEAYQIALDKDTGWMTKPEVRELENLNPLEEEPSGPTE
jgi:HK97 family phage portal protein